MFVSSGIRALDLRAMATDGASGAQGAKITEISPYFHPPPATAEPYCYQHHQPSPPPAPTVPDPQQQHHYHQAAWYSNSQGYYQPSPPSSTYSAQPYPQPHTHFNESQTNSLIYGPPPPSTYSAQLQTSYLSHPYSQNSNSGHATSFSPPQPNPIYGPPPLPWQTSYPSHQYSQNLDSGPLPTPASYYAPPPQPDLYPPPQHNLHTTNINGHLLTHQFPHVSQIPSPHRLPSNQNQWVPLPQAAHVIPSPSSPPPQRNPYPLPPQPNHTEFCQLSSGPSCSPPFSAVPEHKEVLHSGPASALVDEHEKLSPPVSVAVTDKLTLSSPNLHRGDVAVTSNIHSGPASALVEDPASVVVKDVEKTLQQQENVIFDSASCLNPKNDQVTDDDGIKLDKYAVTNSQVHFGTLTGSSIPSSSSVFGLEGNIHIGERPAVILGLVTAQTIALFPSRVVVSSKHDSLVGIDMINGLRVPLHVSPDEIRGVMLNTHESTDSYQQTRVGEGYSSFLRLSPMFHLAQLNLSDTVALEVYHSAVRDSGNLIATDGLISVNDDVKCCTVHEQHEVHYSLLHTLPLSDGINIHVTVPGRFLGGHYGDLCLVNYPGKEASSAETHMDTGLTKSVCCVLLGIITDEPKQLIAATGGTPSMKECYNEQELTEHPICNTAAYPLYDDCYILVLISNDKLSIWVATVSSCLFHVLFFLVGIFYQPITAQGVSLPVAIVWNCLLIPGFKFIFITSGQTHSLLSHASLHNAFCSGSFYVKMHGIGTSLFMWGLGSIITLLVYHIDNQLVGWHLIAKVFETPKDNALESWVAVTTKWGIDALTTSETSLIAIDDLTVSTTQGRGRKIMQLRSHYFELLEFVHSPKHSSPSTSSLLQLLSQRQAHVVLPFHYMLILLLVLLDAYVDCRYPAKLGSAETSTRIKVPQKVNDNVAEGVLQCSAETLMQYLLVFGYQRLAVLMKLTYVPLFSSSDSSEEIPIGVHKCFRVLLQHMELVAKLMPPLLMESPQQYVTMKAMASFGIWLPTRLLRVNGWVLNLLVLIKLKAILLAGGAFLLRELVFVNACIMVPTEAMGHRLVCHLGGQLNLTISHTPIDHYTVCWLHRCWPLAHILEEDLMIRGNMTIYSGFPVLCKRITKQPHIDEHMVQAFDSAIFTSGYSKHKYDTKILLPVLRIACNVDDLVILALLCSLVFDLNQPLL